MRIFWGFLIILTSALLWLVPISRAVYDFRTDLRTDTFTVTTPAASTNVTVTLFDTIYNNDTATLSVTSNVTSDAPALFSYNEATRSTVFNGLTDNITHTLRVAYDISALSGDVAIETILDLTPYFWYLVVVAFPIAGLASIFTGRA